VLPLTSVIKTETIAVDPETINFLHRNAPGEWTSSGADDHIKIRGEWMMAGKQTQDFVLYLVHGGAYVMGSPQLYRQFSFTYSEKLGAPVYSIDYRLAPQHPYPCGLIDVVSGYRHLLKTFAASKIVFIGDR
jgi:acetyl esterase/lipase